MDAPLQAQMQPGGEQLRIAIVGAGVAGPALAALLGRLEQPPRIDILERGAREMEQGSGYDLNNGSRRVLEKAGVMHRYWEMTRPDSNVMSTWIQGQSKAFFSLTQPRWAHSCFGPKYETNRSKLREVLLDAVEKHVSVRFDCPVDGVRQSGRKAELLGKDSTTIGEYDLVVDGSGVGSSLRRYRIQEGPEDTDPERVDKQVALEKAYTGVCMVHGVILDPEASCDKRFVEKLGQGTVSIAGPRGKGFTAQRFGADPADHRSSFFFMVLCDGPGQLEEKIGLPVGCSQWQTGAAMEKIRSYCLPVGSSQWQTGEAMERIRSYLREELGDGWDPAYAGVVDAIDFAAVRPILLHDRNPTFRDNQLPLICIGDALHVVPPWTGAGGNLALVDALDVGTWLARLAKTSQAISIDDLREIERRCMSRAAKKVSDAHEMPERMRKWGDAVKDLDDLSHFTCSQCADLFCDNSCCQRVCFKTLVCCCRPMCNSCGCCRC